MLKFSDFIQTMWSFSSLNEEKHGVYAALYPSKATLRYILDHAKVVGVDPGDPSKIHCTVCYSRKPFKLTTTDLSQFLPAEGVADQMVHFDQQNGNKCAVLKISSASLRGIHGYCRNLGATHDFPTYEPHVTIGYNLKDSVPIIHPSFPIMFDRAEVKPLED